MNKLSLYQRFFLCLAICFCITVCYQFYLAKQMDDTINTTLKRNNDSTVRYTEMYLEEAQKNRDLKLIIEQFKTDNQRLEKQVDLVNDYWKKELNKVNSELFDLKNTKSRVNNNVGGKE